MTALSTPSATAVRAGLVRGRIEFRQSVTNREDLLNLLVPAAIFLIVLLFMRGAKLPGTNLSLGSATVPSVLGAGLVFSGLLGMAGQLTVEREDGTLLRAKATPNGMVGYLIGRSAPSPRWQW
jgi:ABC-2 type transport system permease protein